MFLAENPDVAHNVEVSLYAPSVEMAVSDAARAAGVDVDDLGHRCLLEGVPSGEEEKPLTIDDALVGQRVEVYVDEHLYNIQCSETFTLRNENLHTEA
jgi:hypothetical protein